MNNPIYKVLGKRGRITIPFEIRQRKGFAYNDILSFTEQNDNTVIVKREKLCNGCRVAQTPEEAPTKPITLLEFLDGLNMEEQRAALIHLSVKWAGQENGGNHNTF